MIFYLRPLEVNDAHISWKWRNDPEIWKYTGSHPDIEVTEEIELAWAKKVILDRTRINYAICLEDHTYVGNIYAVNIKGNVGELGIFIGDKSAWGHGIGKEALSLFKKILKAQYGISELKVSVDLRNTAALRCYLSNGAMFEQGGHVMMTMTL